MKRLFQTILLVSLLMPATALANELHINKSGRFGCQNEEIQKILVELAALGAKQEFNEYLGAALITGECILFKDKEPVTLLRREGLLIKVRHKGKDYWTTKESAN